MNSIGVDDADVIVFISRVKLIEDNNSTPPGLHHKSIEVVTPGRDIQFTAPNKERHDLWLSVSYSPLIRLSGSIAADV